MTSCPMLMRFGGHIYYFAFFHTRATYEVPRNGNQPYSTSLIYFPPCSKHLKQMSYTSWAGQEAMILLISLCPAQFWEFEPDKFESSNLTF